MDRVALAVGVRDTLVRSAPSEPARVISDLDLSIAWTTPSLANATIAAIGGPAWRKTRRCCEEQSFDGAAPWTRWGIRRSPSPGRQGDIDPAGSGDLHALLAGPASPRTREAPSNRSGEPEGDSSTDSAQHL